MINYYNYYSKYVFSRFNDYDYIVINHISADILLAENGWNVEVFAESYSFDRIHISLCGEGRVRNVV